MSFALIGGTEDKKNRKVEEEREGERGGSRLELS